MPGITLHDGVAVLDDGSGLLFNLKESTDTPIVNKKHHRKRKKNFKTWQASIFEHKLNEIAQIACNYYEIPIEKIQEHLKKSPELVAKARQLTCYLWGASAADSRIKYNALIVLFGNENHSNISKSRTKVVELCRDKRSGPLFKRELKEMEQQVNALFTE